MATVNVQNSFVSFNEALDLMDYNLREALHSVVSSDCSDQEFVDRYCKLHEVLYSEEFVVN